MKRLGLLLLALRCLSGQVSPCDLNADGVVNVVDIQMAINQAGGRAACTSGNLLQDGCTSADVQVVITAALGGACNASQSIQSTQTQAGPDSVTVYEVDGRNQSGRPVSFGRAFAQGEFAQCLQPVVGGTPITNYQVDVKNRWAADNSVKLATVSFIAPTLAANGSLPVTFQSATSCNNSGFLTQSQMVAFNSGSWGADIEVTAGGVTKIADAKTMLAGLGTNDCQLTYWLQGQVVTQVIAQDCTPTTAYDFGWSWNGSSMTAPTTGNAPTASLHPIFVLSFYPATSSVQVEYILENMWTGRAQDQQYSLVLKGGATGQSTVYTKPTFLHNYRSRWHKTFWAGNAPGHIRIDHNFTYLTSTKALPNYDPSVKVDESADYASFASCSDKGDIMGLGWASSCWPNAWSSPGDYSANNEGAPIQREDLQYLYNMNATTAKDGKSCGAANSNCAKAWDVLTGEVDSNPATTLIGVGGGGGAWSTLGYVPFHLRESRNTGGTYFYCPGYADKNATPSSACGNSDGVIAAGRGLSRDAYPNAFQQGGTLPVNSVGAWTNGNWAGGDCSHWLDYSYVAYLLSGSWYYLDEEYQQANFCLTSPNPDPGSWYGNGFYSYINPSAYSVIRTFAWGLQVAGRAAFLAPDNSVEKNYYTAKVNSNMEVEEGLMNITGTSLTPTTADGNGNVTGCGGTYNRSKANRWNWGRCTVASYCNTTGACTQIPQALHNLATGACTQSLVTGASWSNGIATYTLNSTYGINVGDKAQIVGASPGGYNSGATPVAVTAVTGSTVSVPLASNPGSFTAMGNFSNDPALNWANVTDKDAAWHEWFALSTLGHLNELGLSGVSNVFTELSRRLLEEVLDSTYNPYLIATYEQPIKNGAALCNGAVTYYGTTLNPYISSWANVKQAYPAIYQSMSTFNPTGSVPQFACADHGYSLVARAAGSFASKVSSADPNCPGGSCQGASAWTWLASEVPYFNNNPAHSTGCGTSDAQIKFAIIPR